MNEQQPTKLTPRHLLIAAIVDSINIYQREALLEGGYIKDKKRFDDAGIAKGELWNKKYDVAEMIADRFLGAIRGEVP